MEEESNYTDWYRILMNMAILIPDLPRLIYGRNENFTSISVLLCYIRLRVINSFRTLPKNLRKYYFTDNK